MAASVSVAWVPASFVSLQSQALEAANWAGLLKSPRAVLAGDHLQLPPTVISDEAMHKVSFYPLYSSDIAAAVA